MQIDEPAQFLGTFRDEAVELLGSLETNLLNLEQNPSDTELLSAVFRVMHTIKGSASMFGLERISSFAHEIENILSALRDGTIRFSVSLIDHTLRARDFILAMLKTDDTDPDNEERLRHFLGSFQNAVGLNLIAPDMKPHEKTVWHIHFKPFPDIFFGGTNPLLLLDELRSFGETVCIPNFDAVPTLKSLNPEMCYTGWDLFLSTEKTKNDLLDAFIFVEDSCELSIVALADDTDIDSGMPKKLGEILIESGKLDQNVLERVLGSKKKLGAVLIEEKLITNSDLTIALTEQKIMQKVQKDKEHLMDMSTIRVKSGKLDQLMALVGELVTIHARLTVTARAHEDMDDMTSILELFGRLTNELRDNTITIRMVPVGTAFHGLKRLVRDLSAELGKEINLEISGGETELDKTVIEKLQDPLMHIVRNSIDHGIELPGERERRGKARTGIISLSAKQNGATVEIAIADDGNGLDPEAIRGKALEKGLIGANQELTVESLNRLILLPGFSTKETVSAVSGRGVGMDVVNRQMELIGGSLDIESTRCQGTRISLKIPLTLAILDGLSVRLAESVYIIPLAFIVGCSDFEPVRPESENRYIQYLDSPIPYIDLRQLYQVPGTRPEPEQVVIVRVKEVRIGLLVDSIIGGTQAVIKPLGSIYRRAFGISSASIRGDGSVALILNIEQIVEFASLSKDSALNRSVCGLG